MTDKPPREGEIRLSFDPAIKADATLAFIGRLQSNWTEGTAPKNLIQAREQQDSGATVTLDPGYEAGLDGLEVGQWIWLVLWFDRSRRDLIVQAPRHRPDPRGVFALRSPVRPNPIAIEAVQITSLDHAAGKMGVDATDAFDGTPVLDIKPWMQSIDVPQDAGAD